MPSNSIYIPPFDGSAYIPLTQKGVANGVATLDLNGLIPVEQLPFASPLIYQGNWDASTNTPTLSAGTGVQGNLYICSVAGTQSIGEGSIAYEVGDVIVADENGDWIRVGSVGGAHINGTGFVVASGTSLSYLTGTSSQFVKANGTLDNNVYLTSAILSTANTWTAAQRGVFTTLTDASTIALDLAVSNNFRVVLGGSRTLGVPTNVVAGQSGVLNVWQDITGSRALAFAWCYAFPSGTAPTLDTTKASMTQLSYIVNHAFSSSSITGTNANPAVFTWTSHGLTTGQEIQFTAGTTTTPALNTSYWVTVIDANTFNLSTSLANVGTATFITGSGISGSLTGSVISITISSLGTIS